MHEKVAEYLEKKEKEQRIQWNEFLVKEGLTEYDQEKHMHVPIEMTDDEYERVQKAYEKSIESKNDTFIVPVPENEAGDNSMAKRMSNVAITVVIIFVLGIIIGNSEYILDEYNPKFDGFAMLTFYCYAFAFYAIVSSVAETIKNAWWRIKRK